MVAILLFQPDVINDLQFLRLTAKLRRCEKTFFLFLWDIGGCTLLIRFFCHWESTPATGGNHASGKEENLF